MKGSQTHVLPFRQVIQSKCHSSSRRWRGAHVIPFAEENHNILIGLLNRADKTLSERTDEIEIVNLSINGKCLRATVRSGRSGSERTRRKTEEEEKALFISLLLVICRTMATHCTNERFLLFIFVGIKPKKTGRKKYEVVEQKAAHGRGQGQFE